MKAFVIIPFREEFDPIYIGIKNICESSPFNFIVNRGDTIYRDGLIINQIYDSIVDSDLIFADVSKSNPNVFYEIGYAHALNKRTILIIAKKHYDNLPFDIAGFRCIIYNDSVHLLNEIEKYLENFLSIDFSANNAVIEENNFFIRNSNKNVSFYDKIKGFVSETYSNEFQISSTLKEKDFTIITLSNYFREKVIVKIDLNGNIVKSIKTNN